MARVITKLFIGGAAALAGLLFAVPALAYVVGAGSSATAPAVVTPGVPFTFAVIFVQSDGTPFPAGVAVVFAIGGVTASTHSGSSDGVRLLAAVKTTQTCTATFDPANTSTNASGAASTQVTVSSGCAGETVTLSASATGTSSGTVSTTVTVAGAASAATGSGAEAGSGAFPNTTTLPPSGTPQEPWLAATVFGGGAALLIALVGFMAWRQRRSQHEA